MGMKCMLWAREYMNENKLFPGKTEPTYLRDYEPGEAFGELWLLYNCPRAASIYAKTSGVLYALDRETFNHIVKDSAMKKRQKYEEFLTSVELLKGMEEYDRIWLADAVWEESFNESEYIIKQGEKGDRFFFVLEGEAIVTKKLEHGKAPVELITYTKGSYFGELALLNDAPRAANVIAKTKVFLISLDKDTFKRIMGSADDLIKRNIEKYENYETYGKLDKDIYQLQNIK